MESGHQDVASPSRGNDGALVSRGTTSRVWLWHPWLARAAHGMEAEAGPGLATRLVRGEEGGKVGLALVLGQWERGGEGTRLRGRRGGGPMGKRKGEGQDAGRLGWL